MQGTRPARPRAGTSTDDRSRGGGDPRRGWRAGIAVALVALLGLLGVPLVAQAQTGGFPSVGTAFDRAGPYSVSVVRESAHTYYAPSDVGAGGVRHPVVIWGNGTFNTPSTYDAFLRHLASHGFIVAAANTSNAGSGREMLAGLDHLATKDGRRGDRFEGAVDLSRVAAMGYSQGGGGAMAAARDPRVDTTVAIQPWQGSTSGIRVPTLYLAGSSDWVVSDRSVESDFEQSSGVPAAFGNLRGASHFEVLGDGGGFRGPATAWLRWFLMGDGLGRDVFVGARCTLCTSSAWVEYRANARLPLAGPVDPPPTTTTTTPTTTAPPPTTAPPTPSCFWWFFFRICR